MTADLTPAPFESLAGGATLPPFTLTLERADVVAYLDATGESAERWHTLVPPQLLVARMIGGLMERIEIPDRLLHAGQEFEMHRALPQGEPVEITFDVSSLSVRRGAIMAAFSMHVLAEGEPVATARASVVVPPADDTGGEQ